MLTRNYKSSDYSQLIALWKETGIYREERLDSSMSIEKCNAMGGKLLVMEDPEKSRIVASSWLTWDGRRVLMHHFAVLPSLQNQGYGHTLALESLAFAREKGSPVKLEVHRNNHPAIKLYRNLGFEIIEDYEVYILISAS